MTCRVATQLKSYFQFLVVLPAWYQTYRVLHLNPDLMRQIGVAACEEDQQPVLLVDDLPPAGRFIPRVRPGGPLPAVVFPLAVRPSRLLGC